MKEHAPILYDIDKTHVHDVTEMSDCVALSRFELLLVVGGLVRGFLSKSHSFGMFCAYWRHALSVCHFLVASILYISPAGKTLRNDTCKRVICACVYKDCSSVPHLWPP